MKSADLETKIFIVPTRRGFAYGLWTTTLLIVGAVNSNYALLGVLAFLITLGLLAMHLTHLNLAGLQIKSVEVESGFSAEEGQIRVKASNPLQTPRVSLQIEGQILNLPPGESWFPPLPIAFAERGLRKLTRLKISSVYPLGLFYAWTYWEGESPYFVYPSRKTDPSIGRLEQIHDPRGLGSESEFVGHRKAVEGDSARRINWKHFSKSQKLLFKVYERDTDSPIVLRWENVPSSQVENKLKDFSSTVDHCRKSKRPVSLLLQERKLPAGSTEEHYRNCLESLAMFK